MKSALFLEVHLSPSDVIFNRNLCISETVGPQRLQLWHEQRRPSAVLSIFLCNSWFAMIITFTDCCLEGFSTYSFFLTQMLFFFLSCSFCRIQAKIPGLKRKTE